VYDSTGPDTSEAFVTFASSHSLLPDEAITLAAEELTPQLVQCIGDYCKYAISALDSGDAEQARKGLRAALKML